MANMHGLGQQEELSWVPHMGLKPGPDDDNEQSGVPTSLNYAWSSGLNPKHLVIRMPDQLQMQHIHDTTNHHQTPRYTYQQSIILYTIHYAYSRCPLNSSASMAFLRARSCSFELSLKTWSICSSVRPFVSGTKKNVQMPESTQNMAKKT